MSGPAPLLHDEASIPFRVEAGQAAAAQEISSRRGAWPLRTAFGFAGMMLIAVMVWVVCQLDIHVSALSGLVEPVHHARVAAFTPLPALGPRSILPARPLGSGSRGILPARPLGGLDFKHKGLQPVALSARGPARISKVRMYVGAESTGLDKPLRAKDIVARLKSAGISTVGIFDKDELVRLLNEHEVKMTDAPPPAAAEPPGLEKPLRVKDIVARLQEAGISTTGIFDKEELVQLLNEHEAKLADTSTPLHLPLVELGAGNEGSNLRHGYVEIDVDKGSPLRFLVDTGASFSFCSTAAGRRIGTASDEQWSTGWQAGSQVVTVRSMVRAPGFAASCRVAAVGTMLPPGVDGLLGYDFLATFKSVEFDWGGKAILFHRATVPEAATGMGVPITINQVGGSSLPFVRVAFGNAPPCDSVLDTGSPATMITPELCSQGGDSIQSSGLLSQMDVIQLGADGKEERMNACSCTATLLGPTPIVRNDALVFVGLTSMMASAGWTGKPGALIGLDLLRPQGGKGKTIVDWERSMVTIQ